MPGERRVNPSTRQKNTGVERSQIKSNFPQRGSPFDTGTDTNDNNRQRQRQRQTAARLRRRMR